MAGSVEWPQAFVIAGKEFRDRIRNRWVLAVALIFALFALAIAYFGAAQQGGQGSALANFAQQQRRYAAPYLNSPYGGAGGYGSQPMMRNGYYPTAPRARLQTVPDVAPRQAVPGPFQI